MLYTIQLAQHREWGWVFSLVATVSRLLRCLQVPETIIFCKQWLALMIIHSPTYYVQTAPLTGQLSYSWCEALAIQPLLFGNSVQLNFNRCQVRSDANKGLLCCSPLSESLASGCASFADMIDIDHGKLEVK